MSSYIVHEPLIGNDLLVLGYKLAWHHEKEEIPASADMEAMLLQVSESFISSNKTWLLGDKRLFLEVTPGFLSSDSLKSFPPEKVVLSIDVSHLGNEDALAAVSEYRQLGFGISIGNASPSSVDNGWMRHVTHLEIDCGRVNPDAATQIAEFQQHFHHTRIIGKNIDSWDEHAAFMPCGMDAFAGNFYLEFHPASERKRLNPAQSIILKAMDLVHKNMDVGLIEKELKRDPAITYKLLRYMNTAGFGVGIDISSLRQAVNYLGYSNLNKWLCCMLAMSSTVENASALLETAKIRGIFLELLGRKRMSRNETDQLFVTGIFSLLDRLLEMPMEELLTEIRLAEPIQDALLEGSGIFGRYLWLAKACENGNDPASSIADFLRVSPDTVNAAHLLAIAWAQQIQR